MELAKQMAVLIILVILGPFVLMRCAPQKSVLRPSYIPSSYDLISTLHKRSELIRSLKGRGKVTYIHSGQKRCARVVVIGLMPTHLKFDVIGFWGKPVLSFVTDGFDIFMLSYHKNQLYMGNINSKAISPLWPLSLSVQTVLSVISGSIPIIDYGEESIKFLPEENLYLIHLLSQNGKREQKIWLDIPHSNCVKSEVSDDNGSTFRIEFSKFKRTGDFVSPHLVRTYMSQEETEFTIKFEDLILNGHVTEKDFHLEVPEETEVFCVE